ncbi:protein prenylyltransferase [Rhodofomes roseus]|uniref:Protein farnesyltransferase/geranylgeranyltransferase type-1 subunit alpha n=1 Tax=Rhodofomes roseus TaxID=34475 RepID=A0ABQ8KFA4_9APHY|nr:protein prenylyltransferase [Rhodofomes roseus]KAH9836195.1 protein prenylyltransferase [Rhodofomes roseus]
MSAEFEDVLLYAERPEWADVTPLPQYQGVDALAPINYSAEYQDATDYFRGIVKAGEKSPRVLALTWNIINMNPAHYSAWQYRYKTLLAMGADLEAELRLMDDFAVTNMKTYQVWHHRRLLLTALRSPAAAAAELAFTARVLAGDAKNYHTWSYRQWLLVHFNDDDEGGLWAGERAWVEELLEKDVRNNSAWHHRFLVVWASGVRRGDEDREAVGRTESAFAKDKIALAPNNPSAWNYLRGVLEHTKTPFATLTSFVELYIVSDAAEAPEVVDLDNPAPTEGAQLPCVHALEFLADVYEQEGGEQVAKAVEIWKSLANEHDTMRKKYWEYRIRDGLQGARA